MDQFERCLLTNISSHLEKCCTSACKGDNKNNENHIAYGTAGFRGHSEKIRPIFYKVGLIAGLRCLVQEANVGVMVTASHNPIPDNGVKLIDSNGEMLKIDWEPIVEHFCNIENNPKLINEELLKLTTQFQVDLTNIRTNDRLNVLVGYDTRPSSEGLVELLIHGLSAWSPYINVLNYKRTTTPALHYLVAESNKQQCHIDISEYYMQLVNGLNEIFESYKSIKKYYKPEELIIDCANGVGYETMKFLCSDRLFKEHLPLELINTGEGVLNQNCGADFVKSHLRPSTGACKTMKRYAALDGDADRVVYFFLESTSSGPKLRLLDGDKIMALYALYIKDVLKRANLDCQLSLGIVQTAYANGASTDYLRQQLGLNVDCVETGVKNLHRKASNYDFGLYFEANGHGTIWVSEKAWRLITELDGDAGLELRRILKILNNYTGDAISDILIVESILSCYDMNIESWYKFYEDRPSSLTKVQVKDRRLIKTTNADRTCLKPTGLQNEIDELVQQFLPQARCFVRASGTEDVVRIYAEAKTQDIAERIALLVGEKVIKMCN